MVGWTIANEVSVVAWVDPIVLLIEPLDVSYPRLAVRSRPALKGPTLAQDPKLTFAWAVAVMLASQFRDELSVLPAPLDWESRA